LNLQVLPEGNPVHENEIGEPAAPPTGVTVRVTFPDFPALIVSVLVLEVTVKFSLTVWVNTAEVLLANVESPSYLAVTWCVPAVKVDVVYVAWPAESSAALPKSTAPSMKSTTPVGVAVAGGTAATTAVKFTVSPTCEGFLSDVRLVWLEVGATAKT